MRTLKSSSKVQTDDMQDRISEFSSCGGEVTFLHPISFGFGSAQQALQPVDGDEPFHSPIDDPGKGVEGGNKHVEERQRGEDCCRGERVAQEGEQAKGQEREQQGGRGPEVDAEGVHVLADCQGLQLCFPCLLYLHHHSQVSRHPIS